MVTHNLGLVAEFCENIIVMYAGQMMERGTIDQVIEDPKHPYTRGLLRCLPRIGTRQEKILPIPGLVPDLAVAHRLSLSPAATRCCPNARRRSDSLKVLPDGRLVRCLLY